MLDRDLRQFPAKSADFDGICHIAAAIAGIATVAGATIQGVSAQNAAKTQAGAANQAAQTQLHMYDTTRADLMPYMNTGNNALAQLANLWGIGPGGTGTPNAAAATSALTQFPGYQFGLQQGGLALDRSAASRGLLLSGAQLQDSQKFGTDYAMQQAWNPYVTQLNALSTLGENAAAKTGEIGSGLAGNAGTAQLAAGQALGAGQVGVGNALSGGIQNALLAYQLYGGQGSGPTVQNSWFPTTTPNNALDAAFNAGISPGP